MPKTHVMADRGLYTSHMRTVHDIANSLVAWDSVFYASSTSERGCDNNGCDSVPRAIDDMPNWIDILESSEDDGGADYTVTVFSQDKKTMDAVLDRNSLSYPPMTHAMEDAILDYHFPDTPNQLVLVHFSGLDRVGVVNGYGSINYKALVGCTDDSIDLLSRYLWERCPNGTTFMLMSNHGGNNYEHSSFTMAVIQVPFMMWGHNVAPHVHVDDQALETTQIGPTLLTVLSLEDSIPDFWNDKPIHGIKPRHDCPDGVTFHTLPAPPEGSEDENASCEVLPVSVSHKDIGTMNHVTRAIFLASMVFMSYFFFTF